MARIKITDLDHIVLNVGDIEQSLIFYTGDSRLDGRAGRRVQGRQGRVSFGAHQRCDDHRFVSEQGTFDPRAGAKVDGNLNHFCLVVGADDFAGTVDYLKEKQIGIREGPVSRWGARGRATSVYFLDPDGNEIEIRCY